MTSIDVGPPSDPPKDFKGLTRDEISAEVKEWFFSNFEDPVHSTPYISAEGGYQYIWGGPYDARDEIWDHFGHLLDEELIDAIVRDIEAEGHEWAPHQSRFYEEHDEEDDIKRHSDSIDPDSRGANPAYVDLINRIEELEQMLPSIPRAPSGIGGNNPPEDIGLPPYKDEDEQVIRNSLEILKNQNGWDVDNEEAVKEAGDRLSSIGQRLKLYVMQHADKTLSSFLAAFSTELGKWSARGAAGITVFSVYNGFADKLLEVAQAIQVWLQSIHLPF